MTASATEIAGFVVPFISSLKTVFGSMVGVEITVRQPFLKEEPVESCDVSGIIGFTGGLSGSVVLNFSNAAAAGIVQAFTGTPADVDGSDFADAIGELSSMVAGVARSELGLSANVSAPTVVRGGRHSIARLTDVPCIVIPCGTKVGGFTVEVNVRRGAGLSVRGGI